MHGNHALFDFSAIKTCSALFAFSNKVFAWFKRIGTGLLKTSKFLVNISKILG